MCGVPNPRLCTACPAGVPKQGWMCLGVRLVFLPASVMHVGCTPGAAFSSVPRLTAGQLLSPAGDVHVHTVAHQTPQHVHTVP